MAKSSRYEQWAKGYAPDDTTSFYGFVGVNERNNQLANPNPKQTDGDYGVYGVTPDWAKRTPTEQARVNAAQARAQEQSASPPAVGYAAYSDEYIRRATTEAPTSAPVSPYAQPASPYNYGAPKVETATKPAQKTESGATNHATPPATVPNTDAESPSTVETEPTGYAKYLADQSELAEADRRAEAEYARALPTYGALAEKMAQAGIHGGFGDYLQGVAYAKMQDAKQQGYAALTGNGGTVMSDTAKELYKNLLSEYGDQIAGITDETQYEQFEDLFRSANKGLYSDADVESALKQAREYRTTRKTIDTDTVAQGIADYTTGDGGDNDLLRSLGYDPETFIEPQGEKESDEAYQQRYGEAFIKAVNDAYKENRIGKPQHSAILTTAMPIFDEDFDTMDWKDKGVSIAASIDLAINGDLTDEDYAKVVESVKEHLKSVGVESIYYDHQGIGRSSNLDIKIRGGAKNYEDIHADQVGGDITAAEKKKLEQYGDLPLVYLVNSDGTTTLYYQNEHGWRQLKTKGGSTHGRPDLGNNWYKAIAFLMMNGNKPTETITTSKNQTYKFITK